MSLVSTINAEERADFLNANDAVAGTVSPGFEERPIVTKTIRGYSIYQKGEGAHLSKEALFRTKVKYGIYQSPARNYSKGVAGREAASDAVANLAPGNKGTIEAYKRLFVDRDAHTAAKKSLSTGRPHVEPTVIPKSRSGPHVAATKAYAPNATVKKTKRLQKPSKPSINKAHSPKAAKKASHHASVSQPVEQPKKGAKKPMDLSKVLSSAEIRAHTRVNDMFTPIYSNHDVLTSAQNLNKVRSTSLTGPVYKEKKIVSESPSKDVSGNRGTSKRSAESAASAVLRMNPAVIIDSEYEIKKKERSKLFSQITSEQVLTKARENADKKLDSMVAKEPNRFMFGYKKDSKVVEVPKKESQKQLDDDVHNEGKVNLGGGLWLSPDDINTIAREMVDPLLGEVHQRADDQRAADVDIKDRNDYVTSEWNAWLAMHKTKEHNNEALLYNSENRRTREADAAKNEADRNFTALCNRMDKQVAERTNLLNQTKETRAKLEKETEERLAQNKKDNKATLKDFKAQHADELEQAREEQRQLVQPHEERLEEADRQHENLIQERNEIDQEIAALRESIEEHQTQISKYESDIKYHEEQNANAQEELKNLEADKEDMEAHYNDVLVVNANKAKEQALLSTEEARLKNLEVEAIINERKSELNRTERELQREKLNMLEAMRKTAEIRGDGKIDEGRVKQLIGTTYTEHVEEQEELQRAADKAEKKAAKKARKAQKAEKVERVRKAAVDLKEPPKEDDAELNAREFREIAAARAREAKEKHSQTKVEGTQSVAQEEMGTQPSVAESQKETSRNEIGPSTEKISTISHLSNATEDDAHVTKDVHPHVTEDEGQGIGSGDHQSSYFKEVF